jgi:predicted NBD/HSP70 family sugar kinase
MRIGIDLGGTKIEAIALGPGGRELARKRVPTPQADYAATLQQVVALVFEMEKSLGEKATVGIGMPGALSHVTGMVKNSNSTCLNGRPFRQDIEQALGREVRIENDANCFALSEAVDGAGRAAEVVFGVILGTGVGGGLVVRGRVVTGANHIGGEWGHNPLPLPAGADLPLPACYCGRAGCIEAYLSGPSFARDGKNLERYHERLARSLGVVINIVDPDVVVLGGGMSNLESLYTEVPRLWGRYIFSDRVATRLARAVHGDSGGVRGAAWLWQEATKAP